LREPEEIVNVVSGGNVYIGIGTLILIIILILILT